MTRLETAIAELEDVAEYFRDRQDVLDGDYGVPEPNEEMRMLARVEAAIAAIAKATGQGRE